MSRLLLTTLAIVAAVSFAADEPKKPTRKPWTTSKVTGSPEPPPPYKSVRAFPNVKVNHPTLIARCPGSDRLFVGEQEGVLYSIANKPDAKAEVFFDLKKELKTLDKTAKATGIGELYGLVFHPKFEQNRFCYVCFTLSSPGKLPDGTRVSRFTVTKTDPPQIDPASEEIVITWQGGGHNGGDLHFSPTDGMLYISTGDGSGPNPPDVLNTGQDCSDLLSSILRIDVDKRDPKGAGEPGGVSPRSYAIPKDNPFIGLKDIRPEIWAFGFRNPWRMSFDRKTGDLWVGDVGWELWEMVHKIEKGGNYGWSAVEGRQPVKPNQKLGPTPIRPPTIELPHTIAMSVTGGYVYRGKKFPELLGAYVFGDWESKRFWVAQFEDGRVKEMPEIVKAGIRVSCFGEDNSGEIFYFDYDSGAMYTLEKNDAVGKNSNFPMKLSETGLFKDVKKHEMAEGVQEFSLLEHQWQDGLEADHYVALPGATSVTLFDKPRKLSGQVFWHEFRMQFPKDAVLVKTIYRRLPPNAEGKKLPHRVETQILHHDGEDWRGYSYAWRDDQSDARLVPAEGGEIEFPVADERAVGGKRQQVWTFHSRTQCLVCHNAWSEYALAFTVPQLNNSHGWDHVFESDLITFTRNGTIRRLGADDKPLPPFDLQTERKEQRLKVPFNNDVRSYLHVNCAHCHRFGGGGGQVVLELDHAKPLKETGILDVKPRQGDFGIPDARLIAPGDPGRSLLLYRMAKFGAGHMPHLGAEVPDIHGILNVERWILSLEKKEVARPGLDKLDAMLGEPRSALAFAAAMQYPDEKFSKKDRDVLLAAAAKLPPGPVRDLFEGYLPPDPKGRKIGSNPRPSSILAKTGDAKNGEAIFFSKELKCINCHKLGDKGVSLGADLSAIGKTRTKAELLDSILFPSAKVEPQYASYLVKTHDGRSFTGLLVKRDEKQVVLRDAENKEIVLAADNVEAVQPSRLSMMPDGAVSGLTLQEAADLVEYLASRK